MENYTANTQNEARIGDKVRGLEILDREALVAEWIKINKRRPPLNLSRGLLLRAIAYQIQVTANLRPLTAHIVQAKLTFGVTYALFQTNSTASGGRLADAAPGLG